MMKATPPFWTAFVCAMVLLGCFVGTTTAQDLARYFDPQGRSDVVSGGVRMIPIDTPQGKFRVWTKRVGNNPKIKVLLLHGGPGATHEYLEACDSFLPAAGIEFYYYDQLGSYYSDQPDAPELWETERFVDELEQVRQALDLQPDSFFLYGHSWGGILAIEYAFKHPERLRGLIISNMMSSAPAYDRYADEVLKPQIDQKVLQEIEALEAANDYQNPRYMQLLIEHHYTNHILRMPFAEWPEPVTRMFKHLNGKVYVPMQGPSELGISGHLEKWDRSGDLAKIKTPTLVIGARHDTMDPAHMRWMAETLPRGRYLECPNGSHCAMYDDQQVYFTGLIQFLRDVAGESFVPDSRDQRARPQNESDR